MERVIFFLETCLSSVKNCCVSQERTITIHTHTILLPGAHEMNIAAAWNETCSLKIHHANRQTSGREISVGVERIGLVPVLSRKKGKAMETLEIILGLFSKR